jgi:hypothetical protein
MVPEGGSNDERSEVQATGVYLHYMQCERLRSWWFSLHRPVRASPPQLLLVPVVLLEHLLGGHASSESEFLSASVVNKQLDLGWNDNAAVLNLPPGLLYAGAERR